MSKKLFLLLALFVYTAHADKHSVPAKSDGNRILFTVTNDTKLTLKDVTVNIFSTPEWLVFPKTLANIDSIPAKKQREVGFEFSVPLLQEQKSDSIQIVVKNKDGVLFGTSILNIVVKVPVSKNKLEPPYPNPANPGANIPYAISAPSHVEIDIYNIIGQRVRRLIDVSKPEGKHIAAWDGKDGQGNLVSGGAYFIHITIQDNNTHKHQKFISKIILQK
jgi:hypothetical protein